MNVIRYLIAGNGRQFPKKIYLGIIHTYFKLFEHKPSNKPCIVFAPHQDDETLGCGGTIIQKKRNGALVKIVYMTDGNNSHKHISTRDLKDIRKSEAIAACKVLGISEQDIIFLNYNDGLLSSHYDDAVKQVADILEENCPEEIYIPYIKDHHPDHKATNKIAINAIKKIGKKTTVFEYPTWFWEHWPVVGVRINRKKHYLEHLKFSIKSAFSVLLDLRYSVLIPDELSTKQEALYQHKSQMSRIDNDDKWFILGDVSEGEWLECFFQGHEVFYRHTCH